MDNDDIEKTLNALSDGILGISALQENFEKIKDLEEEVNTKNKKCETLLINAEENAKLIGEQALQSQAILDEIKAIKADFEKKFILLENKENTLIKIVEGLKDNHANTKERTEQSEERPHDKVIPSVRDDKATIPKQIINSTEKITVTNKKDDNYHWENKVIKANKYSYEIIKHIGNLSSEEPLAELNIISWNGKPAKYDIRHFNGNHDILKGLSINKDLLLKVKNLLNAAELNKLLPAGQYGRPYDEGNECIIYRQIGKITIPDTPNFLALTITSWFGHNPKYDLRIWDENYSNPPIKGVTLSYNEIIGLKNLLNDYF